MVDSDAQMLSYNTDSLVYDPDNTNHGINAIDYQPDGTLDAAPDCEFILDEGTQTQLQCQQVGTVSYKGASLFDDGFSVICAYIGFEDAIPKFLHKYIEHN